MNQMQAYRAAALKAAQDAGGFGIAVSDDCEPHSIIVSFKDGESAVLEKIPGDVDFGEAVANWVAVLPPKCLGDISMIVVNESDYDSVTVALNKRNGSVIKLPEGRQNAFPE